MYFRDLAAAPDWQKMKKYCQYLKYLGYNLRNHYFPKQSVLFSTKKLQFSQETSWRDNDIWTCGLYKTNQDDEMSNKQHWNVYLLSYSCSSEFFYYHLKDQINNTHH